MAVALVAAAGRAQVAQTVTVQGGVQVQGTIPLQGGFQTLQTRVGTSRIAGRVLGANGAPIRQASVTVGSPQLGQSKTTLTDADGRFEFRELPAGRYTVTASRAGYINLQYGQTKPEEPPKPVVVADGQSLDNVNLMLPRGGVIAGRVLDDYGEPVTDVQINAMQRRYMQGQLRFVNNGRTAMTNDIGEFRLYGLMPGKYYLSATARPSFAPNGEVRIGYAPTYYPGTASGTDAQPITVGLAETISGIDLSLVTTRLASISGSVVDATGAVLRRGSVTLLSRDGGMAGLSSAPIRDDGTFVLTGVPPGEYFVRATAPLTVGFDAPPQPGARPAPAPPPETMTASVTVNGSDVAGVIVVPTRKLSIAGRFTFDPAAGAALRASMLSISLTTLGFEMVGPTTDSKPVHDDFTFEITAPALEVMLRASVRQQDWVVKAIRVSGVDITDTGMDLRNAGNVADVEVELTNRPPELSGQVSDSRGQPVPNATVVIFPEDRSRWLLDTRLVALVRTDIRGQFRVRSLPAGQYLAAAFELPPPGGLQDPEYLESIRPRSVHVTLADQEAKSLNFTLPGNR